MHTLLSFLNPSNGAPKLRSKAVYALSGLTKHSAPALRQFADADGWDVLRGALQDSDVSVRRKVAFLLNALLIPSVPEAPHANPPNPRAAGVTVHGGADAQAPAQADPVHPNSHAAMMADPGAFATSAATRAALEQRGLLDALVDALVRPVPHGPDGERLGDAEFEEKLVQCVAAFAVTCRPRADDRSVLFTYTTSLQGELAPEHKQALAAYLKDKSADAGGDGPLAESWGLSADELRALRKIVE